MLDTYGRKYVQFLFDGPAKMLSKTKVTPIHITLGAFILGMGAAISLYFNMIYLSVILLWFSGYLDALDGTLARITRKSTELGAFLDITFDRMVELAIVMAFAFNSPEISKMLVVLVSSFLLSISIFLTVGSFAKNTGEKSFHYQAGVTERTEGFIFFTLMILIPSFRLEIGYLFAGLVLFTAGQRYLEAIKILKEE